MVHLSTGEILGGSCLVDPLLSLIVTILYPISAKGSTTVFRFLLFEIRNKIVSCTCNISNYSCPAHMPYPILCVHQSIYM